MFYNNFLKACNLKKKTPSAVAQEIGINKATVTGWKKGSVPTDATVLKLADYFGTSPADLLGGSAPAAPETAEVSADDRQLLAAYHQAAPELRAAVRRVLDLPETDGPAPPGGEVVVCK